MALLAKDEGGKGFDPVEAGVHKAICIAVYDLGTQYNEIFNKSARQVLLMWELPDQRIQIEDRDLPRAISKKYTLSLHEKANLRQDLEGWRGKAFTEKELAGFDVIKLLGVNCQIQVIHKKTERKTYANIKAILPLPKDQWKEPENPLRSFSFEDDETFPEGMQEWVIKIIEESDEYQRKGADYEHYDEEDGPPPDRFDDDIPF